MGKDRKFSSDASLIICLILVIIIAGIILFFKSAGFKVENNNKPTPTTSSRQSTTTQNNQTDKLEVSSDVKDKITSIGAKSFNSKFDTFIGAEITTAQVRSLVSVVTANNGIGLTENIHRVKVLDEDGNDFDVKKLTDSEALFTVKATNYDSDGYITEITVTKNV